MLNYRREVQEVQGETKEVDLSKTVFLSVTSNDACHAMIEASASRLFQQSLYDVDVCSSKITNKITDPFIVAPGFRLRCHGQFLRLGSAFFLQYQFARR